MSQLVPTEPLSIEELTKVLIKHHGLHEGFYDTAIEVQVALGQVGTNPGSPLPGVSIGVARIGLVKAETPGPRSVNAAEVNPPKKTRKSTDA